MDHAVRLIHQICCFAGSFDLIEEFCDQGLGAAIERHDSAVLFDRLMFDFSFQGISDEIAVSYMRRHGRATWRSVRKNLAKQPANLPKAEVLLAFLRRYEKTSRTCAEPDHIATCPLPTHRLRNGHLNQIGYGLYLFIRDVAEGDLVGWIDDRLGDARSPRTSAHGVRSAGSTKLRSKVLQQPWVIAHSGGGPLQSHPATIQYIGILGDAQREIEMLLYEHDADLMS